MKDKEYSVFVQTEKGCALLGKIICRPDDQETMTGLMNTLSTLIPDIVGPNDYYTLCCATEIPEVKPRSGNTTKIDMFPWIHGYGSGRQLFKKGSGTNAD
jgi:hypothetical protein